MKQKSMIPNWIEQLETLEKEAKEDNNANNRT
jgi:hypothetical protein